MTHHRILAIGGCPRSPAAHEARLTTRRLCSRLVSFLAMAAPVAAIALVIIFLWLAIRLLRQLLRGVRPSTRQK
jgi:hypothetical protein